MHRQTATESVTARPLRRRLWTTRRLRAALAATAVGALLALGLPMGASAAPADVAPTRAAAGPLRTAVTDSQTIVVHVGAIRTGSGVNGLAGVQLSLYTGGTGSPDAPGTAVGQPWSTCTSIADGTCTFVVPNAGTGPSNTKGENNGKRFWVVQTAAPSDYYLNPTLITGNNTNSGSDRFTQTPYVYRTPALTGSGTITLPSLTGMPDQSTTGAPLSSTTTSTSNRWATGGVLPASQSNNRVQATCQAGVTVGILFDLSSSMSTNNNEGLDGAKTAGKALVDALADTGSQIALYTFGTNAPKSASGASGQNYPTLTTVTSANASTLKGYIDGYTASGSSINYTNWDRGLWQLAESSNDFDIVVVLTDGNPTVYGPNASSPSGGNAWTTNRHVEEAIFSANALKNKDTQILAFGVGDGISAVTGENLRAISGPLEWTGTGSIANFDYAKTNDWDLVASQLRSLAAGLTCKVPITVTKYEELLGGTTQLGQGWTFGATKSGQGTLTGSASQTTGSNGQAAWNLSFSDAAQTGSVTITETIKNSGWQLKQVVCTNNGEAFYTGTSLSFTLPDLGLGDNIACTVTNQQIQASVVVNKTWVVNGVNYANGAQVPAALQAALQLGGSSQPFGQTKSNITVGSTTTITETVSGVPSLCTVVSQRLTGPGATNVDMSGGATFTTPALSAGLSTYELVNTVTCTSELQLIKNVTNDNGGDAVPADWTLYYGATGIASGTTVTVTPGDYALTESSLAGYAPRATTPLSCTTGLSGTTVTVPIATKVVCTFYNDDIAPTLSLEKIVAGADSVEPENWTLTATSGATVVLSGAGSVPATAVRANTPYTLAETANGFAGAGDFTAGLWECQTDGAGPWTMLGAGGVLPGLEPGVDVHCRITNTAVAAEPDIDKSVDSLTQNADGTWTIVYTVTVTNPGHYAGIVYDLADALQFGGSITTSATATGPAPQAATWNGLANPVLADDIALAADSAHEYTITAIASVPNGALPAVTECPTGDGAGGFLNTAVLTVDGEDYTADACAEPVTPTVSKTADSATANADGTWTVVYTVTVSNDHDIPLFFDLEDDPQSTFPTGVTVVSGATTPATGWDGTTVTTIADDAVVPAHDSVQYQVSVVVSVAPTVTADALDCTADDGGLLNRATMTSGNQVLTAEDCASLTPPTIVHEKSVVSTSQNPDGTWTIVYDVVVKNTGDITGSYDLRDELRAEVAGAISVVSATADGIPAWNGSSEQTLATGRTIAPGEANWQHYTITVVAAVAEGATGTDATRCAIDGGTNGFLNSATITVAGVETEDTACSSPTQPTLTKQFVGAVPAGGNDWTVSYVITVDNSAAGALPAYYTLSDAPGFASELAIGGYVVTETSADPDVDVPWNGGDLVPVARSIAGGAVDTFRVDITVTVPAGIDTDLLECTEEKAPGHGFQNLATVRVGADTLTAVDCGDVTESAVPTITKTVVAGWPKQLADGTWEIAYDIVVASESELDSVYSLDDALGFGAGITVNDASIASDDATVDPDWDGEANTAVVADVVLPGGGTHTYRVTVNASVAGTAYLDGTTACDPTETENGGFLNTATLTSGQADPITAADCASPAQPTIDKELDAANPPVRQDDGSYLVTYLVTVGNPSALVLSYDLDDTLGLPLGVTISGQQATGPDGPVAGWDGIVDTALASGALIDPTSEHVYTITLTATPTAEFDLDDAACTGEPGHGLFNEAVLASGGIEQSDDACGDLPVARLTLVKEVDNSAFDGVDLGDAELGTTDDWVLGATGPVTVTGTSGSATVTSVLVPVGAYALEEEINLESTNPLLPTYTAGEWECTAGLDGSSLALAVGDDVTCTIINTGAPVDLSITKVDGGEADGEPLVPTTEGGTFQYTFTITNEGDTDATGVVVTDEIPDTLAVDLAALVLPENWTATLTGKDDNGFGGTLVFRYLGVFEVGSIADITVTVDVASTLPRVNDDPAGAILDIVNTAVVGSDGVEENPEDNTSTEETPVKALAFQAEAVCVKDAPYASWSITPSHTDGIASSQVVLIWWTEAAYAARDTTIPATDVAGILGDGASKVDVLPTPAGGWVTGTTVTGTQLWPGAEVDPVTLDGIAWPGWIIGGDGEWTLDPTAPFYDLHEKAVLEVRMNPSSASAEAYPPATAGCLPTEPPTEPLPPDDPTPPLPPMLAFTGLNLLGGVAVGVALLAFGIAGRVRRTRA